MKLDRDKALENKLKKGSITQGEDKQFYNQRVLFLHFLLLGSRSKVMKKCDNWQGVIYVRWRNEMKSDEKWI